MPGLNLKGKISKEKSDKLINYYSILLAIVTGLYFILYLGVVGIWISPWSWVAGTAFVVGWFLFSYRSVSRTALKRSLAFILLCAIVVIPMFLVINVTSTRNTAQNLSTAKEVDFFKNLLGRSYNYTELIVWENQHLNFTYGNIDRNTDPIKIYEYGKGRCQEFATLYSTLCISQGYRCRIVDNILSDHVFNEVLLPNGTWTRADSSLNPTGTGAVGNPMFFENTKGWGAPILSLAFENSSITDVTSTYNSNKIPAIVWAIVFAIYGFFIYVIVKYLIQPKFGISSTKQKRDNYLKMQNYTIEDTKRK